MSGWHVEHIGGGLRHRPGSNKHKNTVGLFARSATGFAGFQFDDGEVGWIRLKWQDVNSDGYPDQLTAIDWAYNSTPGESILAGQTAVPEPGSLSLALLAAGSAGVLALRKRRRIAKTTSSHSQDAAGDDDISGTPSLLPMSACEQSTRRAA